MGKVSISLPDVWIKEIDDSATEGVRSFSADVLMRLENEKRLSSFIARFHPEAMNPTGVAKVTVDPAKEISGIKFTTVEDMMPSDEARRIWEDSAKKDAEADGTNIENPLAKLGAGGPVPFRNVIEEGINGGIITSDDVKWLKEEAKKIAKSIPGVVVASEVPEKSSLPLPVKFNKIMADEPRDGSLDTEGITDKMRKKSAKKRPEVTEGRVELIKGFWRETFDSVGDAMVEVAQKGWKPHEYTIKPLK